MMHLQAPFFLQRRQRTALHILGLKHKVGAQFDDRLLCNKKLGGRAAGEGG